MPIIVAAALLSAPVAIVVPSLSPDVRLMIDAALDRDDAKLVGDIVALARQTNPDAAPELDAVMAAYTDRRSAKQAADERARRERLEQAGVLDNWKGNIELGASRSTGNTRNLGLYVAGNAERAGIDWKHKLAVRGDLQRSFGVTTSERIVASWQPNYRLDDRFYAYGLAQYEYDPALGYDDRYTLASGLGYGLVAKRGIKLDLEGGPAVRHTDPVIGETNTTLAGRASLDFGWKITPTLEFKQIGAFYYEPGDSSITASTALDTALIGDLKARLSYNIQYEADRPVGVKSLDTTSRATIVYSF